MKKQKNNLKIEILRDCLLINNKILVISDLHIGYEEVLAGKGIFPRHQLKNMINKLDDIFWSLNLKDIKIKQIIICGDLKHEFGKITNAEWKETIKLLDYLSKKCKEIILIKGNHDNILGPIANKKNIHLKEYYNIDKVCFINGNKLYKNCLNDCEVVVMGHLHPAIKLSDAYKQEKYKCFLNGKWMKKQVYVIPSFNELTFGYDLTQMPDKDCKGFIIIPKKILKKFNIIIYDNKNKKEYGFGKLKGLIKT